MQYDVYQVTKEDLGLEHPNVEFVPGVQAAAVSWSFIVNVSYCLATHHLSVVLFSSLKGILASAQLS